MRATRTRTVAWRGRIMFSRGCCWKRIVRVGIRVDSGCGVVSVLQEGTGSSETAQALADSTHHDGSTKGIVGLCLRSSHVPKPTECSSISSCAFCAFSSVNRYFLVVILNLYQVLIVYKYAREQPQSNPRSKVEI